LTVDEETIRRTQDNYETVEIAKSEIWHGSLEALKGQTAP